MSQLSNEHIKYWLGKFLFWFGFLVRMILTTLAEESRCLSFFSFDTETQ